MEEYDARSSTTSGAEDMEMIPVFTTGNFAEGEIITDIFDEEDIAYIVQNMGERAFPGAVGQSGQSRISVEDSRLSDARGFIQQAIVDDAIPGDGNFIEFEPAKKKKKK